MKHALYLLGILLVGACAPRWEKPGVTQDDFDAANASCEKTAEQKYPLLMHQVLREGAYTTPNQTACFGSAMLADCLRSQSIMVPPTFETLDDNAKPRAQFMDRCLSENGWRPIKDD